MERRIALEGCFNFRDLGGYPADAGLRVRWRRLFRSDALHHLSAGDVAHCIGELGLREVIDLRSSGEVAAEGRGLLEGQLRVHHLPLFDGLIPAAPAAQAELTLADRYLLLADFARQPIGRVLGTLADAPGPVVYHCAAGKDRTGVVSAVLLGLLGVRDEIIALDYAASHEQLDAIVERLSAATGYQELLALLPPDTLHAHPETVLALLAGLRERYGSLEGYARDCGLGDGAAKRLRARLLEPI